MCNTFSHIVPATIGHSSGGHFLVPLQNSQCIFPIDISKNIYINSFKPRIKLSRVLVNHDHKTFDSVKKRFMFMIHQDLGCLNSRLELIDINIF